MNFHQSFKKCIILTPCRHQKTTSNLLRINLKGILKFNEIWPIEGAMYITMWKNFRGHPEKCLVLCNFLRKLYGFRQKRFTGLLELTKLYKQNPLEKFFIFTIYQIYTLALLFFSLAYQTWLIWLCESKPLTTEHVCTLCITLYVYIQRTIRSTYF